MTQQYYGSKIVTGWESEKDGKPGYGVKYADGYTSWSPKDVFEEAYIPMGHTGNLPGWQERIVAEMVQLRDRINKLRRYLELPSSQDNLTDSARSLLEAQLVAMAQYDSILEMRASIHGIYQNWVRP